ncbi:DDE Tnp4 domain-containing protein [Trichostrongylus colubriformis]|uniref:DDE Tnp4 domain-containing protein n=1 Tax=Trichostrongylus colubriformis TaxID=6319 RepID=A0AAN8FMG3_TRICO
MQVCIGIRYLCTNAFQVVVGDTAGCSQKTVSNIVLRVVDALAHPDIVQKLIIFKPEDEQWCRARSHEFARTRKMPNVIGAVDGTLIRIKSPPVDAFQYMSRKGTSCLNVCLIADAVGRILYINSGSPGWVHDATIWRNSSPAAVFNSGVAVPGYRILGDSGYANGSGIITPFRPSAVQGDARKTRYNRGHCRMRSIVEMTTGCLKSRFPILSSELRVGPRKASKIVIACAVLHNIMCLRACTMRQLGSRKATMAQPEADVEDVRAYIVERI